MTIFRKIITALFGRCAVDGHSWVEIAGTAEEEAAAEASYREWFDNYPVGEMYHTAGHTECGLCGKWKVSARGAGRPSGHHPGWG